MGVSRSSHPVTEVSTSPPAKLSAAGSVSDHTAACRRGQAASGRGSPMQA